MSRKPANHANRKITRIETKKVEGKTQVKGWEVRIYRRDQRFNKFMADKDHGGKAKALLAARALRDVMDEKIKPYTRKELATRMSSRTTSGHRGIRVRITRITKGKRKYVYQHVEASWTNENGEVVKRIFSVDKLSLEKAWKQALACRKKGLSQLD
ncbi:MAG: hypothetical protein RL693_2838 [Verrucomicrobiota bacterium]|jgi:hypothetical protein